MLNLFEWFEKRLSIYIYLFIHIHHVSTKQPASLPLDNQISVELSKEVPTDGFGR